MKKRASPLPRWAKLTRNMVIFLLLALIIWTQLGKPLPYAAAVHRKARQYLMPELEHCTDISRGYWGGAIRVDCAEGAAMLSVPVRPFNADFFYYPMETPYRLTEGTNLLCTSWSVLLPGSGNNAIETRAVYIAVFPPEESVRAVLTLRNGSNTYHETAEAVKGAGIFSFLVEPELDENGGYTLGPAGYARGGYTYELEFYDINGDKISK